MSVGGVAVPDWEPGRGGGECRRYGCVCVDGSAVSAGSVWSHTGGLGYPVPRPRVLGLLPPLALERC